MILTTKYLYIRNRRLRHDKTTLVGYYTYEVNLIDYEMT